MHKQAPEVQTESEVSQMEDKDTSAPQAKKERNRNTPVNSIIVYVCIA